MNEKNKEHVDSHQNITQSAGDQLDKYVLCDDYSFCIDANYAKGITFEYFLKTHRRQLVIEMVR